jgi:hypothetical protein
MSNLLRKLIIALGIACISQQSVFAQNACPDMPRAGYEGRSVESEGGPSTDVSTEYWVIPTNTPRSSMDVARTYNNLIANYITKNKPTYTCNNGWTDCVTSNGRFFRGAGSSIIPNKSGGFTKVGTTPYGMQKNVISCKSRAILSYRMLRMWELIPAKPDLPYLILNKSTWPLNVNEYGGSAPSF